MATARRRWGRLGAGEPRSAVTATEQHEADGQKKNRSHSQASSMHLKALVSTCTNMSAPRPRVMGDSREIPGLVSAMQVRFGEFTIDSESRLLRLDDAERHLSPKAFDLLQLLLKNRPRALSKAELHERLWPSTFVSDATLTSLVAEVRAALGETAGHGRFVRTVHRFGYAFEGIAMELAPSEQPPATPARCWIIWEWGQVPLTDGEHLLGRDGDVTVWLESPSVSRHHARIRISGTRPQSKTWGARTAPTCAVIARPRRCLYRRRRDPLRICRRQVSVGGGERRDRDQRSTLG